MKNLDNKLFSPASERNKQPILEALSPHLSSPGDLLEIGSGSGQHAVFFASQLPHIKWHTSDRPVNHPSISSYIHESHSDNLNGPIALTIGEDSLPEPPFKYYYTANTLHIMSSSLVKKLCQMIGQKVKTNDTIFIYGPFKYKGQFTSRSNESFDNSLKINNPDSGIENFEDISLYFKEFDINLAKDISMPANNQLLIFKKS